MVRLNYDFGNLTPSPVAAGPDVSWLPTAQRGVASMGGPVWAPILSVVTSIGSPTSDQRTIREACGVLDRSERGKLALAGADAKSFLQGQVSNDVEALAPGHGCYAAFLTP